MEKFSDYTIEQLDYYVYYLVDPRDNCTFYVGKGKGNRIFQHILGALDNPTSTDKIDLIKEIISEGKEVVHYILRHGLNEKEAFEVESALIDYIGLDNLTNKVLGYSSENRGVMTINDIKIKYEAQEAEINEPVLMININKLFRPDISKEELYEATRYCWRIDTKRAEKMNYVFAVYKGIIREVYRADVWKFAKVDENDNDRYQFEGEIANETVRRKYVNKSVAKYWGNSAQNPIRYAGEDKK